MSQNESRARILSRRDALKACVAPAAGVIAAQLLGACGDQHEGTNDESGDDGAGSNPAAQVTCSPEDGGGALADARASSDGPTDSADAGAHDGSAPSTSADARVIDAGDVPWASGGTQSMQGGYPDPFAAGSAGMACALYPEQTIGPCYAQSPPAREDISEGLVGLPVRLSFLVVQSDGCTPVPDAEVDIWHTSPDGVYSAYASGICNPESLDVVNERFCRGRSSTDENGRVDFSTVFPGWYTGRTIHIHFTVRANGREYITSQLYFDDALSDELMELPDYKRGTNRDTSNQTDAILSLGNLFGGGDLQPLLFSFAKRPDGALHAWKVLSVQT